MPSIMQGSLGVYPHLKNDGKSHLGPSRSLNQAARINKERAIMQENEKMLNRLQDQGSHYNVYDWELDRKQSIKRVKAICYYPPSLLKKGKRKGGYKRSKTTRAGEDEP